MLLVALHDEVRAYVDELRSILSYAVSKKDGTERARLMAFRKCTARMELLLSRVSAGPEYALLLGRHLRRPARAAVSRQYD